MTIDWITIPWDLYIVWKLQVFSFARAMLSLIAPHLDAIDMPHLSPFQITLLDIDATDLGGGKYYQIGNLDVHVRLAEIQITPRISLTTLRVVKIVRLRSLSSLPMGWSKPAVEETYFPSEVCDYHTVDLTSPTFIPIQNETDFCLQWSRLRATTCEIDASMRWQGFHRAFL